MLREEFGVRIELRGSDLHLEGISKNQLLAIDLHDRPAEETLLALLQSVNPDRTATGLANHTQKLVSLLQEKSGDSQGAIVRDETGGSGDERHFYYNQEWQVLEERVGADPDPLSQYVYHPFYVDAVALRYYDENTDDNVVEHAYLYDANFNVTAVGLSSGVVERYDYTAYGEVIVLDDDYSLDDNGDSDIGNEYLYTGRRLDPETGLQLNRNRFYASHLGRWVNRDPIGYYGSPWNLYEYVDSDPSYTTDPDGLAGIGTIIKWVIGQIGSSPAKAPGKMHAPDFRGRDCKCCYIWNCKLIYWGTIGSNPRKKKKSFDNKRFSIPICITRHVNPCWNCPRCPPSPPWHRPFDITVPIPPLPREDWQERPSYYPYHWVRLRCTRSRSGPHEY